MTCEFSGCDNEAMEDERALVFIEGHYSAAVEKRVCPSCYAAYIAGILYGRQRAID